MRQVQALPNGGKCQQIMITANLYRLTVKIHTRQDIRKLIRLRAAPPFGEVRDASQEDKVRKKERNEEESRNERHTKKNRKK